ncbi:hypothetical protein [Diplocloster hominis]|uniref:hypothetical protein n=1 Tax=Diplocloster hominis TaxID=3079010 RepID=UPI0031BB5A0B
MRREVEKKKREIKTVFNNLLTEKKNGGKEIIIELGLMVIAVALIIVFRDKINALLTTIMETAGTRITNLFTF